MNVKKLLCALTCFMLLLSACKKSDDQAPEKVTIPPIPKIKTRTQYVNGTLNRQESYEYDTFGRQIKMTRPNGDYSITEYTPGKIIIKTYGAQSDHVWIDSLGLNDKGYITDYGRESDIIEYTPDGYKAFEAYYDGNDSYSYTYKIENGNTTRRTYRTGAELTYVFIRDIFTFLPNTVNTIGYENQGIFYFGKQDKNLVSEWNAIIENPYNSYKAYYTYEFDEKNRVTKQSYTTSGRENYTTFTYYE